MFSLMIWADPSAIATPAAPEWKEYAKFRVASFVQLMMQHSVVPLGIPCSPSNEEPWT